MGDVHIPMPIDKKRMQEKKIEKLQQQIFNAEQQMIERSALINRLDYLNDLEKQRTNRIMDRLGRTNFTINEEIERLYGDQARSYSVSPVQRGVVEDIISHRTKEFSVAQQEKAMQIKYLHLERKRLQDARERLREKRHNLMYAPSPVDREISELELPLSREGRPNSRPSLQSIHSSGSYVKQTVADLPYAVHRIWKLREDIRYDYETKKKPYNGEMALHTYENWQLEDYVIVRKLVEAFVDDFLIKYIKPDTYFYEREMRSAMMMADHEEYERASGALAERRAVTLVAEELILQQTRKLARETASEVFHVYGTLQNMTDQMFIKQTEKISTGQESGRQPNDPAYNLITKAYFNMQENRNQHRKEIWGHSQHLHLISKTKTDEEEDPPVRDANSEVGGTDSVQNGRESGSAKSAKLSAKKQ